MMGVPGYESEASGYTDLPSTVEQAIKIHRFANWDFVGFLGLSENKDIIGSGSICRGH